MSCLVKHSLWALASWIMAAETFFSAVVQVPALPAYCFTAIVQGWGWGRWVTFAFTSEVTKGTSSSLAANCSFLQVTLWSIPGHWGTLSHGKPEKMRGSSLPSLPRDAVMGNSTRHLWRAGRTLLGLMGLLLVLAKMLTSEFCSKRPAASFTLSILPTN